MLLHRFNSICIILGDPLCRADSQEKGGQLGVREPNISDYLDFQILCWSSGSSYKGCKSEIFKYFSSVVHVG